MSETTLPSFDTDKKFKAREFIILAWKKYSHLESIPKHKQYLTLCNKQSNSERSEINQMVTAGLITKNQYVGIDNDESIIRANKRRHPEAKWFSGDWLKVITRNNFDPAIIYFDTTMLSDNERAADLTLATMRQCNPGTLLLVNLMLNNPRNSNKFDPHNFIDYLRPSTKEQQDWGISYVPLYDYKGTKTTKMGTYCFYYKGAK